MVGTTISHYKILEKLGEGGMGVVYKAHDTDLDRDVALKFLPHHITSSEAEQARFLQEARAAALLSHPNICTIHAIEKCGNDQFIAMEYVEGKTLGEKIQEGVSGQGSGVKHTNAITYAIQIAEALQEAHSHGVVHRDVKSDNIMVNAKNQVKVMDFGLAKLKGSLQLTKNSSTVGTLAYMAPEQIERQEVDARSDIFSFGIVLYEMLTGHLPFRGEHEAAIVYSIVNESPAPLHQYLPDAPSELLHILDRALEKDREDRYQTVQDMLIDLRRLKKDTTRVQRSAHETPLSRESALPPQIGEAKKPGRKWLWLGALGGVLLCAGVAVLVLLFKDRGVRLNPDRTSTTLGIPFRNIWYPALSGDGKWMFFPAQGEDGTFDIYMMNTASGSTPRRVSEQRETLIMGCDISPDLSQISYEASSLGRDQLRLVATLGGQSRTIADSAMNGVWTPDGRRLGFARMGFSVAPSASGKLEIWSVRPDGSDQRLEMMDSAGAQTAPFSYSWSPDGRSIVWVRNFPEGYGEVTVRNLATGREEQLTHDRKRVDEVIWAANGQIIFISNKSGQSNLWTIPARGGEATQITQGTAPILTARIAADTKKILYMQKEMIQQIWASAGDGSRVRQVTTDEVNVLWSAFSPDGVSLAAVIADVDPYKPDRSLCVMDRQGKNRKVLVSSAGLGLIFWSPDSRWLAYRASGRVYLTQPAEPGMPRLLCEGGFPWWMGNEDLSVWRGMKSYHYSLHSGLVGQLSCDSVAVLAQKGTNRILYRNFRQGYEGWWIGSLAALGSEPVNARRVAVLDSSLAMVSVWQFAPLTVSADLQFALFQKGTAPWEGIWRLSLTDGTEERVGTVPAPWMFIQSIARDGKELLWLKNDYRAKLSMIEQPFE